MKLLKTDQGIVLNVYVKPDSREFRIQVEDDELVLNCKESPVKGKVNKELIKELSKVLGKKLKSFRASLRGRREFWSKIALLMKLTVSYLDTNNSAVKS